MKNSTAASNTKTAAPSLLIPTRKPGRRRHGRPARQHGPPSGGNGGSTAPKHRPAVSLGEPPASDLTRELLTVLLAYKAGDFSVRLPTDWTGVPGKIADAFNEIVDFNQRLSSETARVSSVVGKEGKLKQRLSVPGAKGGWGNNVDAVNTLIDDLV